jgi:hypothetical protein
VFKATFNKADGALSWPIALGTYTPTAVLPLSAPPVIPGLSPSGVTTCLGSACIIPNHDSDYNFWPVTIYWYGLPDAEPGFTYNGDTTFQLDGSYSGINIPSHLSNFPSPNSDDVYVPPASTGAQDLPAPCWPTFDQSGNLVNCAATQTNFPAYLPNPDAKSGLAKSILAITAHVVSAIANLVTIGGVF